MIGPKANFYRNLCICFWSILLCYSASAQQQLSYNVIRKGANVGNMKITSTTSTAGQLFFIESNVQVWILVTIKIANIQSDFFKNGVLQKASIIRTVNGSTKMNNNIMQVPGGYITMDKSGDTTMIKGDIKHTIANLYFNEPTHGNPIYSENFLKFLTVKKIGQHMYEIQMPDGNKNVYTYQNGVCIHLKAETDHGVIYFVATPK
jgi:hypothetical protein